MGKLQMFMAGIKIFVSVLITAVALAVVFTPLYLLAHYLFQGTLMMPICIIIHSFFSVILSGIIANWFFKYS